MVLDTMERELKDAMMITGTADCRHVDPAILKHF
jgi:predicted TIM-barrel enzyme